MRSWQELKMMLKKISLTVDSYSNALVEHISVGTNESWYLAQLIYFQVFCGNTLSGLGLDNSDVEVVRLGNSADCS